MFTNPGFYLVWAIIAIIPLILAIFLTETWGGKIVAILVVLVITFGFATLLCTEHEENNGRWNNGYCECGGQYQFSGATNWRGSKNYYYTCDKCGHTEEFSAIMK